MTGYQGDRLNDFIQVSISSTSGEVRALQQWTAERRLDTLVSISSTSGEVRASDRGHPGLRYGKFPLVPLPEKCAPRDAAVQDGAQFQMVSISSTSGEVRALDTSTSYVEDYNKFPLVPLPEKCAPAVDNSATLRYGRCFH